MKHLICTALALSIVLLTEYGVYGQQQRRELDMFDNAMEAPPELLSLPLIQTEILFLDQLLAATNENRDAYMKSRNFQRQQSKPLIKWSGQRDNVLNDFDSNDINNRVEKSLFMERLKQLSEASFYNDELKSIQEITGTIKAPAVNFEMSDGIQWHFKNHDIKKNAKYAHLLPCHLKMCHMGKRKI